MATTTLTSFRLFSTPLSSRPQTLTLTLIRPLTRRRLHLPPIVLSTTIPTSHRVLSSLTSYTFHAPIPFPPTLPLLALLVLEPGATVSTVWRLAALVSVSSLLVQGFVAAVLGWTPPLVDALECFLRGKKKGNS